MTTLDQSLNKFFGEDTPTDISSAIAQTRDVFVSVPAAEGVLAYLEATLAAGAEVRASDEWRERALKAEAALAARVFEAKKFASVAPVVDKPFAGAVFDRAAAEMAAESAQMLAAAEGMAARAGHLGSPDPLQTRIDAAVGGGLLDDIKGFIEEVNASAAAWAAPAPSTIISKLVVEIDTSAIDAALAKVEQLKAALASVAPAPVDLTVQNLLLAELRQLTQGSSAVFASAQHAA